MRHLVDFRIFESSGSGLTQEQEEFLNEWTEGSWTYDPKTGLVDVKGDFKFPNRGLRNLYGVKFGKVSGSFICKHNQLTSLEGAPLEVGGNFDCENNQLTSLEGSPQQVKLYFFCRNNQLTTLKGAPQKVGEDFFCSGNKLTSLEGAPREVGWSFHCSRNKLTSLEGAPQKVGGTFDCDLFQLGDGKWNLEGWLEILKNGKPKAQSLILTLISPDTLNRQIQKDPAGMIMKLKSVWNDKSFRETRGKLIWPRGYEEEMDIVSGLNTIGF